MDTRVVRSEGIFLYDPRTEGYTSGDPITTIQGSPSIASSKLRLNAAIIQSQRSMTFGTIEFLINIPTAPTAGDSREWGLYLINYGNKGRMTFQVDGTTFKVEVYNSAGTVLYSRSLSWSSAWTATDTRFRIKRSERGVSFYAENTQLADFPNNELLPRIPLTFAVSNGNSDNVDIGAISIYGL